MRIRCSLPSLRTFFSTIITLALILLSIQASAQRLPTTVLPEHYSLTLTPDLKAATFTGQESIDVTLAAPSNAITLNALEIAFQSVTITAAGQQQTATVSLDPAKNQATFTFPNQIPAGKATLSIAYTGILNNELRGFYLSKTARRNYAVTQFESTDARRAYPSFDEPAFKATYDVTLVIAAADTAISNSPIETDTPGPAAGKHTLKFFTTPKMSTYLVAFLVGDFQCSSGESDGVAIRVCSTPDKVALTPYGVEVAKHVLHYYNHYFGIPYPLKKLDLIGLPDFEAGAMENFGAITYRETDLLIDAKTASVGAKTNVALVIAHEMAHQWFGDLVTMQWWDNIWLNEGFATWMENKAVAEMHPEWHIDQDVAAGEDGTLNLDAQPTTRAIRAKADTPDEIDQMFDGISYGKASDVLLTVENYVGPEVFRKGVHNYLAAHLYSNATAEDFWNAQTAASHKPVDKIMDSLVAQPGAPILTFGEPANGSPRRISVTQKRFFLSPSIQPDPAQKWTLPVCFKKGSKGQDCQLLTPADSTLKIPSGSLFFANAGGKGYYRSAYPPSVYASLVAGVETALTPAERISLAGGEWTQVRANKAPIGAYLDLASALKSDPNADVVSNALGGINATYERIAGTADDKAALSAWIRSTFGPVLQQLGPAKSTDSPDVRQLRAQLFGVIGYYGNDPAILAQARQIADKYLADPTSIDPTLGNTAQFVAARNGDAAYFSKLQTVYETSTNPSFQIGALRLLSQFEDPALVQRSLDYAASSKVRNQDAAIQFASSLQIDANRDQAWKYIKTNWDKVQAQFTTALTHAIERINGCIELRTLQEPNLKQWLSAQPPK